MKWRRFLSLVAVVVVALGAGAAIAGRPQTIDNDLSSAALTTSVTGANPVGTGSTSTVLTSTVLTSTVLTSTVLTSTSAPTTLQPSTSVASATTRVSPEIPTTPPTATTTTPPTTTTTTPPTTTTTPPTATTTTTPPTPTTATSGPAPFEIDRAATRVMVANATARPGLAEDVAGRLAFAGYLNPISDQALVLRGDTVIVVRSGSQLFGYQVAADLGLSADTVHLRGAGQVSRDDSRADVFVVLGKNWKG